MSCAAAVLDQVPDDEEIAGQIEPPDQRELALDLRPRPRRERPRSVALPRAARRERAEKADGRLPRRQRIVGEPIAEILEREAEPERQLARVRHRLGAVVEHALHRLAALA